MALSTRFLTNPVIVQTCPKKPALALGVLLKERWRDCVFVGSLDRGGFLIFSAKGAGFLFSVLETEGIEDDPVRHSILARADKTTRHRPPYSEPSMIGPQLVLLVDRGLLDAGSVRLRGRWYRQRR